MAVLPYQPWAVKELDRSFHCWKRANTQRAALWAAPTLSSTNQLRVGLCHRNEMSCLEHQWGCQHTKCSGFSAMGANPSTAPSAGNSLPCSWEPPSLCCAALLCLWLQCLITRMEVVLPWGLWKKPGFSSVFVCPKKAVEEERFVFSYHSCA